MTAFTRKDFLKDHFDLKACSRANLDAAVALAEDAFFEVSGLLGTDLSQYLIDQVELGYVAAWMAAQTVNNISAIPRSRADVAEIARAAILLIQDRQREDNELAALAQRVVGHSGKKRD
jgi:hypothetical protein